jgi:hypothetical protein
MNRESPPRTISFPLQTGESGLVAMGRATGMLVAGAAFFAAGLACFSIGTATAALVTTPGVYLFGYSLFRLQLVRQRRASDLRLSPAGIEIAGGPRDRTRLAWPEIDPARSEILVTDESLEQRGGIEIARLVLGLRGNDTLLLAEAQASEEHASLEALLASLRSSRWRGGNASAPTAGVRVLSCPRCGGPLEPADAATVPCAFCNASSNVPEELRARIRAAEHAARSNVPMHAAVTQLLAQPSAANVNARLGVIAAAGPILGIVSLVAGDPAVFVACLGVLLLLYVTVVRAIGRRRAFRALVHVGAQEPVRAGAPYTCRRCGAALPRAGELAILATCLHCQAVNVLGLDLRREAHERASATAELTSALALRDRARTRGNLLFAAGIVLVMAGIAAEVVHA